MISGDLRDSRTTDALTIGGESAGGHLTAVTILRMRDRHGYTGFRGSNVVYGAFDLSPTPSQRQFYPGGARGFTLFPNDLSKAATAKMDAFLNRVLG
jgi:acetyl esterase